MLTTRRLRAPAAWLLVAALTLLLGIGTAAGLRTVWPSADGGGRVLAGAAQSTAPATHGGAPLPHVDHRAQLAHWFASWGWGDQFGLAATFVSIVLRAVFLGWQDIRTPARFRVAIGACGARAPPARGGPAA